MRVAMIGSGYVGLVSGACFSEFGIDVTCVDLDKAKIDGLNAGKVPIYEPGLDELIDVNAKAGRLSFTTDLSQAVREADAVFIAVGTPSRRGDGHADLSYVYAAAKQIAEALDGYTVIVTKSTVPVGTGEEVERIVRETRPDAEFDVVSNPEFLREGAAIEDFMRPDRVVIGTTSEPAQEVMRALYRPLFLIETPILFTSRESAELVKYATNAFLATKITFINEMADLCENVGADVHDVARGMGLDGRIGRKFLHPGPGYGGIVLPQGHTGTGSDGPGRRHSHAYRQLRGVRERRAQEGDGGARADGLRRQRRGQDDRRPRLDLQAQHRRYAGKPEPRYRPGAASGRGGHSNLRSRRHG